MPFVRNAAFVALAALGANAAPADMSLAKRSSLTQSAKSTYNGCTYNVAGVGAFTSSFDVSFASLSSLSAATAANITISSSLIGAGTAPFDRKFNAANVALNTAGQLTLTVPGGQTANPISSAEIQSYAKDILYGSVRTVAKTSSVAGTTHGFSFYSSDTQETDIAFLTVDNAQVHLTNEQTAFGQPSTSFSVSAPSDAATAFHEYRTDWLPGKVNFYIDSVLVYTISQNVPSSAGFWLWNNWSNGDAWAEGPPASDNVLTIQSITGYFNRTSVTVDNKSTVCLNAAAAYTAATSSCSGATGSGNSTITDSNGVSWTADCGHDLSGIGDIYAAATGSYGACLTACDAYKGCNAVAYVGGTGAGTCYMKNVTGLTNIPNVNSGVDTAWRIDSGFTGTGKIATTSSSSTTTSTTTSAVPSTTTTVAGSATSSKASTSTSVSSTTTVPSSTTTSVVPTTTSTTLSTTSKATTTTTTSTTTTTTTSAAATSSAVSYSSAYYVKVAGGAYNGYYLSSTNSGTSTLVSGTSSALQYVSDNSNGNVYASYDSAKYPAYIDPSQSQAALLFNTAVPSADKALSCTGNSAGVVTCTAGGTTYKPQTCSGSSSLFFGTAIGSSCTSVTLSTA